MLSKILTFFQRLFKRKKGFYPSIKHESGHVIKQVPQGEQVLIYPTRNTPVKQLPKLPRINIPLTILVILFIYGILVLRSWLVVARVDGEIITRFTLWQNLEKTYGAQTLDDLANQKLLSKAVDKSNISISQDKIDAAFADLDNKLKTSASLETTLLKRGMTKEDLQKQILLQLKIDKILEDRIQPTEDEIQTEYSTNKNTTYKGKEYSEVRDSIANSLRSRKSVTEFEKWFGEIKATSKVTYYGNYKR